MTPDHTYNIRGWLTSKENDYFRMKLRYCDPVQSTSKPSYTGNISEWSWRHGVEGDENTYGFTYDALSRLKNTSQYVNGTPSARFVETGMLYDLNGNLKNLFRIVSGAGKNIFQYTYTGNRLTGLRDGLQKYSYGYDLNGNMTHDGMNGLDLSYNRQNLVEKVSQNGTTLANYCYLSDGTKLQAVDGNGNGLVYSGSLVYNKQGGVCSLESASFTGGRFVATNTGFTPHYFVTDHLGSTRVVVNSLGAVVEQSNYYPFGSRWNDGQISDNRYLFNGKEAQMFVDVPYLDYGARPYDPVTGRWFNVDPLAEKYYKMNPYVFCGNNPIKFFDRTGMSFDSFDDRYEDTKDLFYWEEQGRLKRERLGVVTMASYGLDDDNSVSEVPNKPNIGSISEAEEETEGKDENNEKQNDDSAILGSAIGLTGVLLADDATGIGVVDDILIPVIWSGVTIYYIVKGTESAFQYFSNNSDKAGYNKDSAEHTKNKRGSTKEKHETGQSRKKQDKGGERGDARRKRHK